MTITATPLREAAKFIRGITFKPEDVCPPSEEGAVVCMRTKNVQADILLSDVIAIPEAFVRRAEQNLIEGDLLVSSANSWNLVGKACWVPQLPYSATAGGFISILRCDRKSVFPRYFYHWVTSGQTQHDLRQCGRQTTNISNLDFDRALDLEIPLPPLAEQKRIAAILDKADAIRRKLQQSLRLSDDFLGSVFLDMFGDPVTNPMGWPIVTIRDLLASTAYGTSRKASETEGEFACLRMNNITYSGGWDFTSLKYVNLEGRELTNNLVRSGQLLFNRTNSKELVGKTAVYRRKEPMAFAGYLVRGIANADADTEFISAFLNLPYGKSILQGMCKNIIGMANINAEEFKSIRIPKPPVQLQRKFAKIVMSVESQRSNLQSCLTESKNLFSSLQQRAFRGEL